MDELQHTPSMAKLNLFVLSQHPAHLLWLWGVEIAALKGSLL